MQNQPQIQYTAEHFSRAAQRAREGGDNASARQLENMALDVARQASAEGDRPIDEVRANYRSAIERATEAGDMESARELERVYWSLEQQTVGGRARNVGRSVRQGSETAVRSTIGVPVSLVNLGREAMEFATGKQNPNTEYVPFGAVDLMDRQRDDPNAFTLGYYEPQSNFQESAAFAGEFVPGILTGTAGRTLVSQTGRGAGAIGRNLVRSGREAALPFAVGEATGQAAGLAFGEDARNMGRGMGANVSAVGGVWRAFSRPQALNEIARRTGRELGDLDNREIDRLTRELMEQARLSEVPITVAEAHSLIADNPRLADLAVRADLRRGEGRVAELQRARRSQDNPSGSARTRRGQIEQAVNRFAKDALGAIETADGGLDVKSGQNIVADITGRAETAAQRLRRARSRLVRPLYAEADNQPIPASEVQAIADDLDAAIDSLPANSEARRAAERLRDGLYRRSDWDDATQQAYLSRIDVIQGELARRGPNAPARGSQERVDLIQELDDLRAEMRAGDVELETRPSVLDVLYQDFRDRANNARPGDPDYVPPAGQGRYTPIINRIGQATARNPYIQQARDVYGRVTQDTIRPILAGPLGQMADDQIKTVSDTVDRLLGPAGEAGHVDQGQLRATVARIGRQEGGREAVEALILAHLDNTASQAVVSPRANPGAQIAEALAGDVGRHRNMLVLLQELDRIDRRNGLGNVNRVQAYQNLIQLTRATGQFGRRGQGAGAAEVSPTQMEAIITRMLGGVTTLARNLAGTVDRAAAASDRDALYRTMSQLLLSDDPRAVAQLREVANADWRTQTGQAAFYSWLMSAPIMSQALDQNDTPSEDETRQRAVEALR